MPMIQACLTLLVIQICISHIALYQYSRAQAGILTGLSPRSSACLLVGRSGNELWKTD